MTARTSGAGHVVPPGRAVRNRWPVSSRVPCRCTLDRESLFLHREPTPPVPLSRCELHELVLSLPRNLRNAAWDVCYDTEHDGFSLQNYYRAMQKVHEMGESGIGIFLVTEVSHDAGEHTADEHLGTSGERSDKDDRHLPTSPPMGAVVMGCFTPQVPCLEHSQRAYYGTSGTFLFKFNDLSDGNIDVPRREGAWNDSCYSPCGSPRHMSPTLSRDNDIDGGSSFPRSQPCSPRHRQPPPIPRLLTRYAWAGVESNSRFVVCANDFFGIGGGRDGAAIFVGENLTHGTSSAYCATFASPPLCGRPRNSLPHSEFIIIRMVWFRLTDQKGRFGANELFSDEPCDCGRELEVCEGIGADVYLVHKSQTQCESSSDIAHQRGGWHICTD
ncbi:putative TLD [Trypanosoma vivax]|uniref:Oxidation resistance protein 1 n=1 Tax=Trypanosoma vivax (strain Y486) TaxID=1055687 RepID=G0TZ34_TRYVY|nr:putative TLD [Trypanosoma vivax]CCC49237.1 conserved hypothetical protein [Trypanosoma vivax Y486]